MKYLLRGLFIGALMAIAMSVSLVSFAEAEPSVSPGPEGDILPIYISGFRLTVNPSSSSVDVFEMYNPGSTVVSLEGWIFTASDEVGNACSVQLGDYLLPKGFMLFTANGVYEELPEGVRIFEPGCSLEDAMISRLELSDSNGVTEQISDVKVGEYVRVNTTSTYRGGTFAHDFNLLQANGNRRPQSFYYDGWYRPLETTPIKITEVMAHSRSCSPLENTMGCMDYVRLHNTASETWSLKGLRLRIGYAGQSPTTSNAIPLGGTLASNGYGIIATKADGGGLSITDSGGWVWLEDEYGVQSRPLTDSEGVSTVVAYPSASSATKVGWAWAYNPSTNDWQWTTRLAASNQSSEFYLPSEEDDGSNEKSTLKSCRSDQYRNPETNRCKLIASSSGSSLKPCAPSQYRNPETNRCRNVSSTSSSLTPCASNQYRNPETNRCKSLASTTSSLKPCAANQERNPTTNRCRNVQAATMPTADFPVESSEKTNDQSLGWIAFAGVGAMAIGYAGWEWRYEIAGIFRKLKGLVVKA